MFQPLPVFDAVRIPDPGHSNSFVVLSHVVLTSGSLVIYGVENLFICLLDMCVFLGEVSVQISSYYRGGIKRKEEIQKNLHNKSKHKNNKCFS